MNPNRWPDPPGWDPTPCCGSHAFLPFTYLAARLRLYVRAVVVRPWWCDDPPWPQG